MRDAVYAALCANATGVMYFRVLCGRSSARTHEYDWVRLLFERRYLACLARVLRLAVCATSICAATQVVPTCDWSLSSTDRDAKFVCQQYVCLYSYYSAC